MTQRPTEPDCDRCDDTGLDPDAYTEQRDVNGTVTSYRPMPCRDCRPDDYEAGA